MMTSAFQTRLARGVLLFVLTACWLPIPVTATVPPVPLRGSTEIHDPSTIIQCKDRYYTFGTGPGIISKSSADKVFWVEGPPVFATPPAWVTTATPAFNGDFWAPDILQINGRYCLYYSVSTWQSQVSAIGLATNPSLDPEDPDYQWTDQGIVIQSFNGSAYNTIDPSVTFDADGNPWMAFGSYWNGIYLVQLDPVTGQRIAPGSPLYRLASNSSIEACCLYRRGQYYYLFVNWGSCCSGVNSTYHVRVGRSTSITGPYRDRNGVDLRASGGTLFMEATGKFAGPGHVGVLAGNGERWLSYHYYDAGAYAPWYGAYGVAHFDLRPLQFADDDWPVFENDWSAVYDFQADARDENGQYYGLLEGGASIQTDPVHGRVLNLSGVNQSVRLPPGVANARTFSAVVKWDGGGAWQRIFDFGVDTSDYVMLTPSSGDGRLRCDLRVNGATQVLEWSNPLPTGTWTHVAVTFDGSRGLLYVNGALVASNSSMNFSPFEVRAQTNHLGRSKFVADPDFSGQIATFSAYGRALSGEEITAPQPVIAQPLDGSVYWPGSVVSFNGSATDFADVSLAPSNLEWQLEEVFAGQTNLVFGPVVGVTRGAFSIPTNATRGGVYRVRLTATDMLARQRSVAVSLVPAHPPSPPAAYYPLTTDASDANGHFDGTLEGGATIQPDPVRGSALQLSGSGQFLSLPEGAGDFMTFMAWVNWNGGGAWQRILDAGNDTTGYCVLTPAAANGRLRFSITVNGIPGEQIIDAPGPLPVGVWTHVAVVLDGNRGVLYTNGVPVATNVALNLLPSDLGATNVWLGRSHWPDPYFNGRISAARLFPRALTQEEIRCPRPVIAQPAQGAVYHPGETLHFSGSATDFQDATLSATSLTWTVQLHLDAGRLTVLGPVSGVTNGLFTVPAGGIAASNGFYRIQLVAEDALSCRATNVVDVYRAASAGSEEWASFYPFTSAADDASNRFDGTLVGGASIVADPDRAQVVNLSGSGQYVNLPAGVGGVRTFSGWVKWDGGGAWQRIFDFGVDTGRWLFLTPKDGTGRMQCALTYDGSDYVRVIQAPAPLPMNQWVHVAVVLDGRQGVLYTNGQAAAVNNSVNLFPSDIGATKTHLGKSQFPDPYLSGRLDSVRLNSRALSISEITAPTPVITTPGPGSLYAGGETISFEGTATDYADSALASSLFTWSAEFHRDGQIDSVLGPWVGVTNAMFQVPTVGPGSTNVFYRVKLQVVDTAGNEGAAFVDVDPVIGVIDLVTVPAGLQLGLDGDLWVAPASVPAVAGFQRNLTAPSPQNPGGTNYDFVIWSDGGPASHLITVPATNVSYTASYVKPALLIGVSGTNVLLSWPEWAAALEVRSATNLTPPVVWHPVPEVSHPGNGLEHLTLPLREGNRFFRLQSR